MWEFYDEKFITDATEAPRSHNIFMNIKKKSHSCAVISPFKYYHLLHINKYSYVFYIIHIFDRGSIEFYLLGVTFTSCNILDLTPVNFLIVTLIHNLDSPKRIRHWVKLKKFKRSQYLISLTIYLYILIYIFLNINFSYIHNHKPHRIINILLESSCIFFYYRQINYLLFICV